MSDLKHQTLWGFIFKLGERGASQGINFVVQIILARMLMPEEFGIIALLLILMNVLDVFVTYGFGNSLVVNKKADNLDFSTCLYFGLGLSVILYVVLFTSASYVSYFLYDSSDLSLLIKILALRLPISAINSVQNAYLAKKMHFRQLFYATLIGTVISGSIGIVMAYLKFGIFALVFFYLSNALFSTIFLWILSEWRPIWAFSFSRLRVIYDYGWKILCVGLIDTIYTQIYSIIIAKKYTAADLAYYNRGNSFPNLGISLIEPVIDGVLFPALSNCNDNPKMMKAVTKKVSNISSYVMGSLMFMLMAIAQPLVIVILTEKWLPCVIFLQIACIAGFFRPLQIINNCVIRSSGHSGLLLKINLLKKGIGVTLLLISMRFGIIAIALSLLVTNIISTIINIFPNRKILSYGYREQVGDLCKNIVAPIFMSGIIWLITFTPLPNLFKLLLQVVLGFLLLIIISKLLKVDSYSYLVNIAYSKIVRHKAI